MSPLTSILLGAAALTVGATLFVAAALQLQGRAARRRAPLLPAAPAPHEGRARPQRRGQPPPLRLLVLGDSVAAGVGVGNHEQALPGCCARPLAARLQREVHWRAVGLIGATARRVRHQLAPVATLAQPEYGFAAPFAPDVVILSAGVNDAIALRSAADYARQLVAIVGELRRGEDGSHPLVLLAGLPQMEHFPALPQPLRAFLGWRSRVLDRTARAVARRFPAVLHVPAPPARRRAFADDGYHPGPRAYRAWGQALAAAVGDALALPAADVRVKR